MNHGAEYDVSQDGLSYTPKNVKIDRPISGHQHTKMRSHGRRRADLSRSKIAKFHGDYADDRSVSTQVIEVYVRKMLQFRTQPPLKRLHLRRRVSTRSNNRPTAVNWHAINLPQWSNAQSS